MLLAIDIGNSFTKFGIFVGGTLVHRFAVPTNSNQTADEIYTPLFNYPIDAVIISSVVPEQNDFHLAATKNRFFVEPVFVDNTFDFNLKINYFPLESLGVDRLINAFAAAETYGKPCIVCSFGTATTIDAISSKSEYLGGTITPGINLMSQALFINTSKLPRVELTKPETVFGNSTEKSIQAGIHFGYIGLVEGIIERMRCELSEKSIIIATGGAAQIIAENSCKIDSVNENLQLEGLRLVYEKRFK